MTESNFETSLIVHYLTGQDVRMYPPMCRAIDRAVEAAFQRGRESMRQEMQMNLMEIPQPEPFTMERMLADDQV